MATHYHQWPIARRAGKACLSCRARKVKCDVEAHGQPCTNCVTDDTDCRVQKSRRGRKPSKGDAPARAPQEDHEFESVSVQMSFTDSDSTALGPPQPMRRHTTEWLPEYEKHMPSWAPDNATPANSDGQAHWLFQKTNHNALERLHHEVTWASLIDPNRATNFASSTADISETPTTSSSLSVETTNDQLPDFIKPISPNLSPDDIDYLSRKGAFCIPSPSFLDALVRSYIRYFHPFMPLLDLPTLFHCISGNRSHDDPKVSILLFQAVMFAGATFVDLDKIWGAGFSTRREARKAFYDRARVLYDLDVDCDRIPVIQAALLLSYWSETPGDNKGGWHWTGICYSLALTLGLHIKADSVVPNRHVHLRRRIWWSFFMRDRLLALAMSRPLRIRESEFNTPMLTLDDFDLGDYAAGQLNDPVLTTDCQTALAELCIEMARLCMEIGAVVDLHFSLLPSNDQMQATKDHTGRTTTILFPKFHAGKLKSVLFHDQKLRDWFDSRCPSAMFQSPVPTDNRSSSSALSVHQAFLHICFCSAMSALHRPLVDRRSNSANDAGFSEYRTLSVMRIEEAGIEMAAMNRGLHDLDLAGFLPPTAATLELPIIITHVKRLQKSSRVVLQSLESIFYCLKVLEKIQELYIGVDMVMAFVMDILRRGDIVLETGSNGEMTTLGYQGDSYSITNAMSKSATGQPDPPAEQNRSDSEPWWLSRESNARDGPAISNGQPGGLSDSSLGSAHTPCDALDLPQAQWNSYDDIFLTEGMDPDSTFRLMVDFESLNEFDPAEFEPVADTEV